MYVFDLSSNIRFFSTETETFYASVNSEAHDWDRIYSYVFLLCLVSHQGPYLRSSIFSMSSVLSFSSAPSLYSVFSVMSCVFWSSLFIFSLMCLYSDYGLFYLHWLYPPFVTFIYIPYLWTLAYRLCLCPLLVSMFKSSVYVLFHILCLYLLLRSSYI